MIIRKSITQIKKKKNSNYKKMMKKKLEHHGREEDNAEREDIKIKRGAEEGRGEKKKEGNFLKSKRRE